MPSKASLRVATFNIQHAAIGDYGRGYPERLAEACRQIDADIIGLQEVDRGVPRSQKADLARVAAEATGMNYYFAKARTYRGRGAYGNALLVRGDILGVEVIRLKGDRHKVEIGGHVFEPLPEPRNAIIANVQVNDYELAVGVTHAGGRNKREQLALAASRLLCRPGPHVLLGDFNLQWPDARHCLAGHGLEVPQGPYTNPSWEPSQQIDHVAYNDLELKGVTVLPRLPVSDHLALIAEFIFAE